jgi:hypothetical protein
MKKLITTVTSIFFAASTLLPTLASAEREAELPRRARLLLPVACSEPPFDQEELISNMRVELLGNGTELYDARESVELGEAVLLVVDTPSCSPAGVIIRVEDPATGRRFERHIDVTDRQRHERARIIALALAELLDETWPRLDDEAVEIGETIESGGEQPATEAAPNRARLEAETRARPPLDEEAMPRQIHGALLSLSLVVRSYPIVQSGQLGGQLGVSIRLSQRVPLRLALDVGYSYGGGTSELGDIRVHSTLGGLSLLIVSESQRVLGVIGPRTEIGWAWAGGLRHEGLEGVLEGQVDGLIVAVGLTGGGRFRLSDRLWISVDGQVGWYVSGLEPLVEGRSLGGVSRALLSLSIGLLIGL